MTERPLPSPTLMPPARRAHILSIPDLLTFNGGYVDASSFLALQGLFTAHVTGNFVTLGASLVLGSSGAIAKVLALPVFCVAVFLVRLLSDQLPRLTGSALIGLLGLQTVLLGIAAVLALIYGPFINADTPIAVGTGMVLVAAMAIQNAVHRIHFTKSPPTTIMTGNTTQIMIDLADWARGLAPESSAARRARIAALGRALTIFAAGSAVGALVYAGFHHIQREDMVFVLPVLAAFVTLLLQIRWAEQPGS